MNEQETRAPGALPRESWLAFAFGVIFCSVLLYLGTVVVNPTPLTIRIYVTVLALAAGGVGAVLPGFFELRYKGIVRAGGAIGLAVLVYCFEPAIGSSVPKFQEPAASAGPVVSQFLAALDTGKPAVSWALLPDAARALVDNNEQTWDELYKNDVAPLGAVMSRQLVGQDVLRSPPGAPPGIYNIFTFRTRRAAEQGSRMEAVTVRANAGGAWEVYSYMISPTTT